MPRISQLTSIPCDNAACPTGVLVCVLCVNPVLKCFLYEALDDS
jgi:hypothetical protein